MAATTCYDCGAEGEGFYPSWIFEGTMCGNKRCHRCKDCHEQAVRLHTRCTHGGFSSGFGDKRVVKGFHFGLGVEGSYVRTAYRGAA